MARPIRPGVATLGGSGTAISDPYARRRTKIELQPWERVALPVDGDQPKVSVGRESYSDPLGFSFTTGRFAVLGANVYDLESGTQLGRLSIPRDVSLHWPAVSGDGKLVAAQEATKRNIINIWSVETGKLAREISAGNSGATLCWMGFRNATELVMVWSPWQSGKGSVCQIWNASTGAGLLAFGPERGSTRFGQGEFTLSGDGAKVVYQDHSTAKAQRAFRPGLLVRDLTADVKKTISYQAPQGGMSDLLDLAVSPDGKKIIAASQSSQSSLHVIVWQSESDVQRRIYPFVVPTVVPSKMWFLQWTPDGSAYMVGANILFDQSSGRVLWVLEYSSNSGIGGDPWRFLDNDNLLIRDTNSLVNDRLVSVLVPWKDIRASQAAMASGRPAYLKPGDKVGIDLDLPKPAATAPIAGDVNPAAAAANSSYVALGTAVAERLKLEGFVIDQNAPARFFVRYRPAGLAVRSAAKRSGTSPRGAAGQRGGAAEAT